MTRNYQFYDDREFVKVWMTSNSIHQVAIKLGREKRSVQSKASKLRSFGVRLPKFSAVKPDLNSPAELNKLIDKYTKGKHNG